MRLAVGFGIAFAACGCADGGERATIPRTARDVRFDEPIPTLATQHLTPPAEPVPSRSLGYLGNEPIGVLPTPPHHEPAWTRPFPCRWTNSCYPVLLVPYYPPYVEVYSEE